MGSLYSKGTRSQLDEVTRGQAPTLHRCSEGIEVRRLILPARNLARAEKKKRETEGRQKRSLRKKKKRMNEGKQTELREAEVRQKRSMRKKKKMMNEGKQTGKRTNSTSLMPWLLVAAAFASKSRPLGALFCCRSKRNWFFLPVLRFRFVSNWRRSFLPLSISLRFRKKIQAKMKKMNGAAAASGSRFVSIPYCYPNPQIFSPNPSVFSPLSSEPSLAMINLFSFSNH